MQIPRFFISSQDIEPNVISIAETSLPYSFTIKSASIIKQITLVLRLRAGNIIRLLNNSGELWECSLVNLVKKNITCQVIKIEKQIQAKLPSFTVIIPLIKGSRFDFCLEKLTEIGTDQIIPLITERTVIKANEGLSNHKRSRWQTILKESAEQCERWTIPLIVEPIKFKQCLQSLTIKHKFNVGFICIERADVLALRSALDELNDEAPNQVSVLLGPEGGFTNEEIDLAIKSGWKSVSLGPRILRSETAAIYSLALISSHFEN
jgi:16S rRNA (uracil1498-N3)-methyltransferase